MKTLVVTDTVSADLSQNLPFAPGNSVVAVNTTGGALTIASRPTAGGSNSNIATIPANGSAEIVIDDSFLILTATGTVVLLQN